MNITKMSNKNKLCKIIEFRIQIEIVISQFWLLFMFAVLVHGFIVENNKIITTTTFAAATAAAAPANVDIGMLIMKKRAIRSTLTIKSIWKTQRRRKIERIKTTIAMDTNLDGMEFT